MKSACLALVLAVVGSAVAYPQAPVPQDGTILLHKPAGVPPTQAQQNPNPAPPVFGGVFLQKPPQSAAVQEESVDLSDVSQINEESTGEQVNRQKRQFGFGGIGLGVGLIGGGFGGGPGFYGGYPRPYGGYGHGYGGYGGYGYGGYGYGGYGGYGHGHHHHHHHGW